MIRSYIKDIASYVPERRVSNAELLNLINKKQQYLPDGSLEKLFGIQERRYAEKLEQVSDLAVKAASQILDRIDAVEIDFMIFAAATADLIEPATCNIIQSKLGLSCPCVDLKNACNSFVSAIQMADAYIKAGIYRNILIVCGEKLSDGVAKEIKDIAHLKRALAAFTLGDAGAAALISASDDASGIYYHGFMTEGSQWELCTIKGGGSMYPHDASMNYFEGKTTELKDAMIVHCKNFVNDALNHHIAGFEEIDHVVTHQVSSQIFDVVAAQTGLDQSKFITTFDRYGNTASASIPITIVEGIKANKIKKGDRIVVVGLAAGLSVCVQKIIW